MKTILVSTTLAALLLAHPSTSNSADDARVSTLGALGWDTSDAHWNRILRERTSLSDIPLGKSDFTVSSPVIGMFRRQPVPEGSSRWRRFASLPIVSSLVPQKMERPPGGTGSYWAWRESDQPWQTRASLAAKPPGHEMNWAYKLVGGQ